MDYFQNYKIKMKLFKQFAGTAPEWDAFIGYEAKDFEDVRDNEKVRVGKCIRISINIFRIFILKFELVLNYFWK